MGWRNRAQPARGVEQKVRGHKLSGVCPQGALKQKSVKVGAEKWLCVQDNTQTERGHAGVFDSLSAIRRHSSSIKAYQTTSKWALGSTQLPIQ